MAEEIEPGSREIQMIMILDELSLRYGLLPSETMNRATTFDLAIMDLAQSYKNHLMEESNAKASGRQPVPELSQEQLLAIMNKDKK
jgi:hypothetical protein